MDTIVVFVHGWSVTHTNTYGHLPERLANEGEHHGLTITVEEIHLGRYISFHDEVRVKDISRAFETAVAEQLAPLLTSGRRFVCITHSTGGPVIREWWRRYYQGSDAPICPMSHLIMLAPANYGSALAVLGKGRISRLKSWLGGIEPGQGVLDWLALGSAPAWDLNREWIESQDLYIGPENVFPFVITGQSIDRAFYDNLNSYTGELGSDGVVRVAAANLQSNYVRLVQQAPVPGPKPGQFQAPELRLDAMQSAAKTPLRIVAGKAHSGNRKGIMKSVRAAAGTRKDQSTVDAILSCITVRTNDDYQTINQAFEAATERVQEDERLEVEPRLLLPDNYFIHDRFSMVIFRVTDHEGYPVTDFDLILTAGPESNPNHLPKGFFVDRQLNPNNQNTVTYYFNHSIMTGCDEVLDKNGKVVRPRLQGTSALGFIITARPDAGFAHYMPCRITGSAEILRSVIAPNASTMVDIVLRRVVGKETFRLDKGIGARNFKGTKPGAPLAE